MAQRDLDGGLAQGLHGSVVHEGSELLVDLTLDGCLAPQLDPGLYSG